MALSKIALSTRVYDSLTLPDYGSRKLLSLLEYTIHLPCPTMALENCSLSLPPECRRQRGSTAPILQERARRC
jgi:hypothetical protein